VANCLRHSGHEYVRPALTWQDAGLVDEGSVDGRPGTSRRRNGEYRGRETEAAAVLRRLSTVVRRESRIWRRAMSTVDRRSTNRADDNTDGDANESRHVMNGAKRCRHHIANN
jgi:hypothetical protein